MNAPAVNECISDETLAAFVEGRLDGREREAVIEHLASCGECRSQLNDARQIVDMLDAEDKMTNEAPNVAEFPSSRRWVWAGGLAAAAVVAVVVLGPMRKSIFDEPAIPQLVEASKSLEERKLYGRPLGGFPYKKINRMRGDANESPELPLLQVQGKMVNARRRDDHAFGVLALLEGKTAEAIKSFEAALAKTPEKRETIEQDLVVALIERQDKGDLERAVAISTAALAKNKTPEAAWNRALALEFLDKNDLAIAAWNDYLNLDPDSEWAAEAKKRRDSLQNPL